MVMRCGCCILLSVGFAVSLVQHKFSDLAFSNNLVRPSFILHCAGYVLVEPLDGFSSVTVPAVPAVLHSMNCRRFPSVVVQPFWLRLPVLEAWGRQPPFHLRSHGFSCAGCLTDDRWVPHPVRLPFVGCYWLFLRVVLPKRLCLLFV